jgi:hypothetical protein
MDIFGNLNITGGTMNYEVVQTATDYNVSGNTIIVGVTNTDVSRTVTILDSAFEKGRVFIVNDESGGAGSNKIIVKREGEQTIDNSVAGVDIATNYGSVRVYMSADGKVYTW